MEISKELIALLEKQKHEVEAERDAYLMQVNNNIGQYMGRIAQIDLLLSVPPAEPVKNADEPKSDQ